MQVNKIILQTRTFVYFQDSFMVLYPILFLALNSSDSIFECKKKNKGFLKPSSFEQRKIVSLLDSFFRRD